MSIFGKKEAAARTLLAIAVGLSGSIPVARAAQIVEGGGVVVYGHPTTYEGPGPCDENSTIANGCFAPRKIYPVTNSCYMFEGASYFDVPIVEACAPIVEPGGTKCKTVPVFGGRNSCTRK